jgi:EAL domain-containing protein (putative c-di-GMP-specific phosphodiesterase class I)
MIGAQVSPVSDTKSRRSTNPLCFIVDEDFIFRQALAKELRRTDIDVVELSDSSRVLEMVDNQNPDIVLVNLNKTAPHGCVRTLLALKESGYSGAVQLFGQCDPQMMESLKIIGSDCSLRMLPPVQKPIKIATIHRIILDQKLNVAPVSPGTVPLGEALAKNMVKFLYQPKLDLKRKVIVGAEAVARVNHPELGLLTPDQFIKGADEDALLGLSRLALVSALKASAHFHRSGVPLQFAINISADNLLALPIADLVLMHRPEGDGWTGILLEVSERQVVNRIERLKARCAKLQEAGASIAIDNFGRGSLCLDIMNQISFAEIKIDRSLVQDCATNPGNLKICKTAIHMAHNFGSKAVAVGISTASDLGRLLELDCDLGQGFLLGKPMGLQQIADQISNSNVGMQKPGDSSISRVAQD